MQEDRERAVETDPIVVLVRASIGTEAQLLCRMRELSVVVSQQRIMPLVGTREGHQTVLRCARNRRSAARARVRAIR